MSILNFLEYRTYCFNRARHPEISAENYQMLFENWQEYEEKYQLNKEYWKDYIGGKIHENN